MKTFGFYSPSRREFVMIVAHGIDDAIHILNEFNTQYGVTCDDYIIAGGVLHRENDINTFTCF